LGYDFLNEMKKKNEMMMIFDHDMKIVVDEMIEMVDGEMNYEMVDGGEMKKKMVELS